MGRPRSSASVSQNTSFGLGCLRCLIVIPVATLALLTPRVALVATLTLKFAAFAALATLAAFTTLLVLNQPDPVRLLLVTFQHAQGKLRILDGGLLLLHLLDRLHNERGVWG